MSDLRYAPTPPPAHPVRLAPRPAERPPHRRAKRALWVLIALALALLVVAPPCLLCARYWPVSAETRAEIVELLNASPDFRHAQVARGLGDLRAGGPGLPSVEDGRLTLRRERLGAEVYTGCWRFQPEDGSPLVAIQFRVDASTRELTFHPAHA
jgi:hypothetical protein